MSQAALSPKQRLQRELAVVVLNFRTPGLVVDCVESLADQIDPRRACAVVVDNASGDDSVEQIERAVLERGWSERVQIAVSGQNQGFSAGNNLGIRAVDADAYLLLNSDTLVRPGAIEELLRAARAFPDAGIISPRLEWPDGTPQVSSFRYRTPVSEFLAAAATGPLTRLLRSYEVPLLPADEPAWPEWTSFAAVLLRRAMIEQIGDLDEGYFMYLEDIDYCRRARDAGWRILHWPSARVVHLIGASSPVEQAIASRTRPPTYYYLSRSRYFAKFYGTPGLWLSNLLWWLGRAVSLAREVAGHRERHTCEREWLDIWHNASRPLQAPRPPADPE